MRADSTDDLTTYNMDQFRSSYTVRMLAVAILLALPIGLLSACGGDNGDDDPATSLSSAATEIADDLNEAAADVGDSDLDNLADNVIDNARQLARVAEPDYDDLGDLDETTDAVWSVNAAIERYMDRAATVAEGAASEARAEAALGAVERAASFISDSSWHPGWADLVRRWDVLNFEEKAIDYEERHRERYLEAGDKSSEVYAAWTNANAAYHVARAEAAVASFGDADARRDASDALTEASNNRDDAQADLDRAGEDWNYFYDLIVWRDNWRDG